MRSYVAIELLIPVTTLVVTAILILTYTNDVESIYEALIAVERFAVTRAAAVLLFESLLFIGVLCIRHILYPRTTNMELLQIYHVVIFPYMTTFFNIIKWSNLHNFLSVSSLQMLSMAIVLSHMRVVLEFYNYRMNSLLSEIEASNSFIADEARHRHQRKIRALRREIMRPTIAIPFILCFALYSFKNYQDGPMPLYYRTSLFVALKLIIQYSKVLLKGSLDILGSSNQTRKMPQTIYAKAIINFSLDLLEFYIILLVSLNSVARAFRADSIMDLIKGTAHNKDHLSLQSRYFYIFLIELFSLNESFVRCSHELKKVKRARLVLKKFSVLVDPTYDEIYGAPREVVCADPDAHESIETCSICMGGFTLFGEEAKKNPAKKLPCNHLYHRDCIQSWIVSGNTLCPLCNRDIFNSAPQQGLPRDELLPPEDNEQLQQEQEQEQTEDKEPDVKFNLDQQQPTETEALANPGTEAGTEIYKNPILFEMPVFSLRSHVDWENLSLDDVRESIKQSTEVYLERLGAYRKLRSHVREAGLFVNIVADI